jgi:hypothetical protein
VELSQLERAAPTFDFCSDGTVIQYLNPLNAQKQIFTVPYQPMPFIDWPPVLTPAVAHPPPVISPPVVVPPVIVPPDVVLPPVDHHHGDDCGHTTTPPTPTPEPGSYALMFVGGTFLIVLGRRH